jgi:hypothetical protein
MMTVTQFTRLLGWVTVGLMLVVISLRLLISFLSGCVGGANEII